MNGYGIFIDKSGDVYEGGWINGLKEGYGVYYWGDGRWKDHKYEGNWKNGKMHGFGRYSYPSGTYYEGEWDADMMHGKGVKSKIFLFKVYNFANGDFYKGDWKDDRRHGYGVFKFNSHHCKYKGRFKVNIYGIILFWNGVRHGKGILIWQNGDRYEGEWKLNSRIGKGILYCADGRVYEQIWNEPIGTLYYKIEPERFPSFYLGNSKLI